MLEILDISSKLVLSLLMYSTFNDQQERTIILQYITKNKFINKTYSTLFNKLANTEHSMHLYFQEELNVKELELFNELIELDITPALNYKLICIEHLINYYKNAIHSTTDTDKLATYMKEIENLNLLKTEKEDNRNYFELVTTGVDTPLFTGYEQLDKKIALSKNNTYVIGAGTGKGKSTYALNIATKLCNNNNKGLYFSLEMTKEEVAKSMMSSITSIERWKFQYQNFEDIELNLIKKKSKKLDEMQLEVVDNCFNYYGIENKIRQSEVDFVVIDYIGLVEHPERDIRIRTSKISRELKLLSKKLNICIIIVVQLNRQAEVERPSVIHLAESADLERDASGVLLIHRDRGSIEADLIIAKSRFSGTDTIPLIFELQYGRIKEGSTIETDKNGEITY